MAEKFKSTHEHLLDIRVQDSATKPIQNVVNKVQKQISSLTEGLVLAAQTPRGSGIEPKREVYGTREVYRGQGGRWVSRPEPPKPGYEGVGLSDALVMTLGSVALGIEAAGGFIKKMFDRSKQLMPEPGDLDQRAIGAKATPGEKAQVEATRRQPIPVFLVGMEASLLKAMLGGRPMGAGINLSEEDRVEKKRAITLGKVLKNILAPIKGPFAQLGIGAFAGYAFAPVIDTLLNTLLPLMNPLQDFLVSIIHVVLVPLVQQVLPRLQDMFMRLTYKVLPYLRDIGEKVTKWIVDWIDRMIGWIDQGGLERLNEGFSEFMGLVRKFIGRITTGIEDVQSWLELFSLWRDRLFEINQNVREFVGWITTGSPDVKRWSDVLKGATENLATSMQWLGEAIQNIKEFVTWIVTFGKTGEEAKERIKEYKEGAGIISQAIRETFKEMKAAGGPISYTFGAAGKRFTESEQPPAKVTPAPSLQEGGLIKETGMVYAHAGEAVVSKNQQGLTAQRAGELVHLLRDIKFLLRDGFEETLYHAEFMQYHQGQSFVDQGLKLT